MRLLSLTPPQLAMLIPNDSAAATAAAAAATTEMLHGESPIDMRARHSMELIRRKCAARLQRQLQNSALRLEKALEVDALGATVGKITSSRATLPSSRSLVPRTTSGANAATGRTSPSRNSRIIANNLGAARMSPGRQRPVSASMPRRLHRSVGARQTATNVAATQANSPRRRRNPFATRDGPITSATGTMLWAGPSELADNLSTEFFDAAKTAAQSQSNDAEDGVKHFSIADRSSPQLASRAQHFQEVAQTLETAVSAVSAVKNGKKPGLDCNAIAQSTNSPPHQVATPLGSLRNMNNTTPRSSFRHAPHSKKSSFDRNVAPNSFATSRSEAVKNAVANLALENRALKGALNNAVKRLSELEGEQECFMSEGVFDLVNSICRDGSACNMAVAPAPGAAEVAAGPSAVDAARAKGTKEA
mmetsp:Transcript_64098/g.126794  ORF Transcript_64098/g.126794 Transcript_64098/m.126794 type:complete len:419 (-) Transcript_64098:123-1379(-)